MILQNLTSTLPDWRRTHCVVQFVELCVAPEHEPFLPSDVDDHFVNLGEKEESESIRTTPEITFNKAAIGFFWGTTSR